MSARSCAVSLVLATALLVGCQVDLTVGIRVDEDGAGDVTVAVGLDDAALARAGNLEAQLRVDDLRSAGWTVSPPAREGEMTWVRASKGFSTSTQAASVVTELTGPDGPFRDFDVRVDDSVLGTDYTLDGTVDLTGGPAAFGDDELTALLGGDPFGGTLQAIERDEGRPISEMVDFEVVVELPGAASPAVYSPSFVDEEPTQVSATSSRRSGVVTYAIWSAIAIVGVIVLLVLRKAFVRASR